MTAVLPDPVLPRQRTSSDHVVATPAAATAAAPAHGEPPKLTAEQLRRTHLETLSADRRDYSLAARVLFVVMDLLYGRRRTFAKFRVLEVVARVPYQSWEHATYQRIGGTQGRVHLARRLFDRVLEFRAQQDNEQWHLLIMDELAAREPGRRSRLMHTVMPKLMAFGSWHLSWLMYVVRPDWSHRLNADFEDHAEHEYAEFVRDNPALEQVPWSSEVCAAYGDHPTVAQLLRQISHDERCHKQESEIHLREPRLP